MVIECETTTTRVERGWETMWNRMRQTCGTEGRSFWTRPGVDLEQGVAAGPERDGSQPGTGGRELEWERLVGGVFCTGEWAGNRMDSWQVYLAWRRAGKVSKNPGLKAGGLGVIHLVRIFCAIPSLFLWESTVRSLKAWDGWVGGVLMDVLMALWYSGAQFWWLNHRIVFLVRIFAPGWLAEWGAVLCNALHL